MCRTHFIDCTAQWEFGKFQFELLSRHEDSYIASNLTYDQPTLSDVVVVP